MGGPVYLRESPGPSPINKILAVAIPSPGTALVRPLHRLHFEQVETSTATSLSISSDDIATLPLPKILIQGYLVTTQVLS